MDIPRGHAMLPLNESDFLDFLFNYFKAEYYPIRSFFSTATAEPRQQHRWISMGHELSPLAFRAANAQAQKDLESLDYFVRQKNLDASFVRGIVIRFAKYEIHERLEKKLYESCRLDLMVRKALKEKHLIDSLWPSPAPRNIPQGLLQQGVKVRSWYGDMFNKYFRHLHSVDDFSLRPEVDSHIKSSGTLMLVPFVDHLVFGAVDPIMPIVTKGTGYANAKAWKTKSREGGSFGEPDRFEIRFDTPADLEDTHTRSVVRQCQCLKCGSNRDVTVVISIDPSPGPASQVSRSARRPSYPNMSARKQNSKASQKYSPGYAMPGPEQAPSAPPTAVSTTPGNPPRSEPVKPIQQKQCSKCTFLNHPELTSCEMRAATLSDSELISKPPSPILAPSRPRPPPDAQSKSHGRSQKSKALHSHSESVPPPVVKDREAEEVQKEGEASRPVVLNRHSLGSTLFSIFPFSQQQQTEHHAKLPATQETPSAEKHSARPKSKDGKKPVPRDTDSVQKEEAAASKHSRAINVPPNLIDAEPPHASEWEEEGHRKLEAKEAPSTPPLDQPPQLNILPMTPPPSSSTRALPRDMPANLMDDFVPVSPSYPRDEEEEDAGWGEMSREEAKRDESEDEDDEEEGWEQRRGLVDLDAVAREEMGVWGDKDDD